MKPRLMSIAYVLAICIVLVLSILSFLDTRELLRTEGVGRTTRDAIERLEAVQITADEFEGNAQAFLLTGDPSYSTAFQASSQTLDDQEAAADQATAGRPGLEHDRDVLRGLIQQMRTGTIRGLSRPDGQVQTHPDDALIRDLAGTRAALGRIATQMRAELEAQLVVERAQHRFLRNGSVVIAGGGVVALAVILVIGFLLLQERQRRKAIEMDHNRFFDLSIDLFCLANIKGFFTRVNPAFPRLLGYTLEELTTRPIMAFVHPDDRERSLHELAVLGEGKDLIEFENRYVCKDGSIVWLMWNCKSYLSRQMVFGTARNITRAKIMERKLLENEQNLERALRAERRSLLELQSHSVALERSNRELKEFAHVAAHDLQEPLRMVSSYCAMLGETYRGKLDPDADEIITLAVDGAKRMQVLIQDMLVYARVDSSALQLAAAALSPIIGEARLNLQAAISESRAQIVYDELPDVWVDRRQIVQLLQNLIGNAIKYRSEEIPVIRITASRIEHAWRISIMDNGIGIAPRHHDRVFGMFKRLHTRDKYSGTGIGLAVCRKIVEIHGGTIWVESTGVGGSTFHFTIPDQPSPTATPGPVPILPAAPSTTTSSNSVVSAGVEAQESITA